MAGIVAGYAVAATVGPHCAVGGNVGPFPVVANFAADCYTAVAPDDAAGAGVAIDLADTEAATDY